MIASDEIRETLKSCGCILNHNCSLHAAAPEMYEALNSWIELWNMRPLDSGCDMQEILTRCWAKTDKALAKAEGEAAVHLRGNPM